MAWDSHTADNQPAIFILTATVFICSLSFAIVIPSLWFFINYLGGSKIDLGLIVAIYSLGQFIFSIIFGKTAKRYPVYSIIVSLILATGGNILYSFSQNIITVLISRFLVGAGAANVSIARSLASHCSAEQDRVGVMAILSASQGLSFILGPLIGIGISMLPTNYSHIYVLHHGKFTYVGFFSALLCILNSILYFWFKKPAHAEKFAKSMENIQIMKGQYQEIEKQDFTTTTTTTFESVNAIKIHSKHFPNFVFYCLLVLFFIITSNFSVFETIAVPFTKEAYGFGIVQNGYLFAVAGLVAVLSYIFLSSLKKYNFDDRILLGVGLVLCLVGFSTMTLWSKIFTSTTAFKVKSVNKAHSLDSSLPLWRFILGAIIQSIGYPFAQGVAFGFFTKAMPPHLIESTMGYMTAAGSFARMIGPLYSTILYDHIGAFSAFFATSILIILGIAILLLSWNQLYPYREYVSENLSDSILEFLYPTKKDDDSQSSQTHQLSLDEHENFFYPNLNSSNDVRNSLTAEHVYYLETENTVNSSLNF